MKKHRLWLVSLVVLVVPLSLVPLAQAHHGHGGPKMFTLASGNGTPPGSDPFNTFSVDNGVTWEQALIVAKCGAPGPLDPVSCIAWADPIPGSEWIAVSADKSGPPSSLYRRFFKLPRRCGAATLAIDVHADNDVTISLNGVVFGQQPAGPLFENFQDPPEHFVTSGPFGKKRKNVLDFSVRDYGNPTGLDYLGTVTCTGKKHGHHGHHDK